MTGAVVGFDGWSINSALRQFRFKNGQRIRFHPFAIDRDPIQQTLARLGVRLAELAAWRDRELYSMAEAKFRTIAEESWRTVRT